ncbi:MAG: protoheme IX farnesyltransferase [Euryarchaeota archaeon RBG_16_68_12]|nr:MAG: protoheme IX farnesyltransferase [Euryarchaeota archaeon RBG_16_68_12]
MGSLRDYVQLMKVRIAALLLLVALAGFIVTVGTAIDWASLGSLLVAGFLASTGSSVVNSYVDRDIDPLMERTRRRALPMHRISPPEKVLAFGLTLIGSGIVVAFFLNNPLTAGFIALGAATYLGVYTVALKRRSESNIVIGGFAGSCPALAGSAAAAGAVSLGAGLIALLVFLWTPGHFWALAYRQKEDYRRAGLPMLPADRDDPTAVKAIAGSSMIVAGFAVAFALTPAFGFAYLVVALATAAGMMYVTWRFSSRPSPATAWAGYRYSSMYLGLLLLGVILDAIVRIRLPF